MLLMPQILLRDVYDLTDEFIKEHGIRGIIFDIDNTLVGFRTPVPTKENLELFARLQESGVQLAIASNNNKNRVETFSKDLGIPFYHRSCKPLGFVLGKICRQFGLPRKQVALVGDQIYTDMLGGNCAGMQTLLVEPIDHKETVFFKVKRALERPVIERRRKMEEKK